MKEKKSELRSLLGQPSGRNTHLLASVSVLLWVMGWIGCGGDPAPTQTEQTRAPEASFVSAPAVETATVSRQTLSRRIRCTGSIEAPPQSVATLNVPVEVFVREIKPITGSYVRKGERVATLYHPAIIRLQRDFLQARAELGYLSLEVARQQTLAEATAGTEQIRQQAAADYERAQAQVAALAQELALLRIDTANLTATQLQESIALYAPLSGYVAEVFVNRGSHVAAGAPLLELIDPGHLHLELQVFEQDVPWLKPGQTVRCQAGNQTFEAEVFSLGPRIDAQKRTLQVHAHLSTEQEAPRPGTFVRAEIETASDTFLTVPEAAVQQADGFSFVRLSGGEKRPVGVLERREGQAVLGQGSGLREHDEVIVGKEMPGALY